MNAEAKQIALASELAAERWVYCGDGKWSDPQTWITYHESVAIKIMRQRKASSKPSAKKIPNLILCSDWRQLAKEMRKQLKPHGLTVTIKTNRRWGDNVAVEVSKLPSPKPVKCSDCGLMSDDPRCCANDEELWK